MPVMTHFPEVVVERHKGAIQKVLYIDTDGETLDLTPMRTMLVTSDIEPQDVPKTSFTLMARLRDVEV